MLYAKDFSFGEAVGEWLEDLLSVLPGLPPKLTCYQPTICRVPSSRKSIRFDGFYASFGFVMIKCVEIHESSATSGMDGIYGL